MRPANIVCFRHIGLTLTPLSRCCAVHSRCIEESAGCTTSFSGRLTIGHLLPDSKIDARERISNSICCFPCCSIWWLLVLYHGMVLCNPYTAPVTSIKKPWPATVSRPENALFKLWPLDRDSGLEKLSFVVWSGLF